jgi:hypothetical protein
VLGGLRPRPGPVHRLWPGGRQPPRALHPPRPSGVPALGRLCHACRLRPSSTRAAWSPPTWPCPATLARRPPPTRSAPSSATFRSPCPEQIASCLIDFDLQARVSSDAVFIQNCFVDTHDLRFPWLAFFSSQCIKVYEVGGVEGKRVDCHCGITAQIASCLIDFDLQARELRGHHWVLFQGGKSSEVYKNDRPPGVLHPPSSTRATALLLHGASDFSHEATKQCKSSYQECSMRGGRVNAVNVC